MVFGYIGASVEARNMQTLKIVTIIQQKHDHSIKKKLFVDGSESF
jgi:hypothetical protein